METDRKGEIQIQTYLEKLHVMVLCESLYSFQHEKRKTLCKAEISAWDILSEYDNIYRVDGLGERRVIQRPLWSGRLESVCCDMN
jgi:hypothetical protein